MNFTLPASAQLQALQDIESWLQSHPDERVKLNATIFGIANRMRVHPHDLSQYILIRTASL